MADSNTPVLDAEALRLFANSIERYGQEKYSFSARKPLLQSPPGFSVQAWSDYADMGWLAAPLPLEDGGFGSHPVAVAALMRYAGEHLALEPLFASVVVCGRLLALCGTSGGAHQRLGALATAPGFLRWPMRRTLLPHWTVTSRPIAMMADSRGARWWCCMGTWLTS